MTNGNDIARVDHWESVWKGTAGVHGFSRFNYYDARLADLFRSLVSPGGRVVEVGCGGSRWVGFFHSILQCETWGIDYSPEGLKILTEADSQGMRLVLGDFFDKSKLPNDYFDLVYSLGFIEHFTDPTVVTRRFADVLRPGGKVMTLVPNFTSIYGRLQKLFAPDIFAKHVVMNGAALDSSHAAAGLKPVMRGGFWGCFGPGVVSYGSSQRWVIVPVKLLQHTVCWGLHWLHCDRDSRTASPYVVGVYSK